MNVMDVTNSQSVTVPNWNAVDVDGKEFASSTTAFQSVRARDSMLAISYNLKEFVCMELSIVAAVEKVYASKIGNVMHVYTVVDAFDNEVRKNIYAREAEIIDEFDYLEFDFDIVSRRGRELSAVLHHKAFDFCYDRPHKS